MSQAVLEERRIKELFKEALLEVLQGRGDLFYDLVVEAIEEIAMVRSHIFRYSTKTILVLH